MFGKKQAATMSSRTFKVWHALFFVAMIVVALGIWFATLYWPKAIVRVGGQDVKVLVAHTPAHWFKGLSDRKSLGKYGGMLFVFPASEQHPMVMRDMKFSLDIIWIQNGLIVDIAPNLAPDPSPTESGLVVYAARLPSDSVLELPAGFAQEHGLAVGDSVVVAR